MIQCCSKEHLRLIKHIHSPLKNEISGTIFSNIKIYIKNSFHWCSADKPHIHLNNRKLPVVSEMCRNVHTCISSLHRKVPMARHKTKSRKEILDHFLKLLS